MTLTNFLLARIAEDEARAGAPEFPGWPTDPKVVRDDRDTWMGPDTVLMHLGRFLAECDSRRRILSLHAQARTPYELEKGLPGVCGSETSSEYHTDGRGYSTAWPCPTIRALALPYADHPDFREEWSTGRSFSLRD